MTLQEDFNSPKFKGALSKEIIATVEMLGVENIDVDLNNITKIQDDAYSIAMLAKSTIQGDTLDIHKLNAAMTIAILMNNPLRVKAGTTPNKIAHYANELMLLLSHIYFSIEAHNLQLWKVEFDTPLV